MTYLKSILTLALCAGFAGAASAQTIDKAALAASSEKADWPKDKVIDCKGAPKAAVTTVPREILGFARIVCTKTGHQFMAKHGWHWHYSQAGLAPFFVSAGSSLAVNGQIPEDTGHKAYFTKIEVSRIDYAGTFGKFYSAELSKNPVILAANQAILADKKQPLQISLTTMKGETMIIHVIDTFKPHPFAYVATIPGTNSVVLMNDLAKVAQHQAAQPKAK